MEVEYDNSASGSGQDWDLNTVRIYIPAPDGRAGAVELDPNPTTLDHKYLLYYYDHLGSIQAIIEHGATTLAWDFSTSPRQTLYSYEAWGQRRDASDWLGSADSQTTYTWGGGHDVTPRGFTGHEQMDDLGLIHMNGRIYDPLLGRFLSADLLVQNPGSVQSYNRYSYVFNNPLRYTDPTGYTFEQQVADSGDTNTAEHVRAARRFRIHEPLFTDLLFDNGALAAELANQASEEADPSAPATQAVDQEAPTTGSDEGQVAEDEPAGEDEVVGEVRGSDTGSQGSQLSEEEVAYLRIFYSSIDENGKIGDTVAFWAQITKAAKDFGDEELQRYSGRQLAESFFHDSKEGMAIAFFAGGPTGGGRSIIGRSFGKLGVVVSRPNLARIAGFSGHSVDRAITRGVAPGIILETFRNPVVVLKQSSGNFLFLGSKAAVVTNASGRVVTTYGRSTFDDAINAILNTVE